MVGSHRNYTHVDEGALKWAIKYIKECGGRNIINFLDIGCGPMGMVQLALNHGLEAYGIDADMKLLTEQIAKCPERLYLTDFRYTCLELPIHFDIIWSIETVEHIPEKNVDNFMETCFLNIQGNINGNGIVIMTHGLPQTLGDSHVHCKEEQYWIDKFEEFRFIFDEHLTKELKKHSTMKREFIQNTGKVFRWK